jgi:hypothetical protein
MTDPLPVVVFAFNRPDKLRRILAALSQQNIDRLLVFIDGPRINADLPQVEACRTLARSIRWISPELHFWEQNQGLGGIIENISLALHAYSWAVFVEDDCLPMPGFYAFMRQALERYASQPEVFSIGGYQRLPPHYLKNNPNIVVSCAHFICWGWATWRDRWLTLLPDVNRYSELFDHLHHFPDTGGQDLAKMARAMATGKIYESWDVKVAVSCLYQQRVHLLATRGLVRNIGQDRSGAHGSFRTALRDRFTHNQNVVDKLPPDLFWLTDVQVDDEYAARLLAYLVESQRPALQLLFTRGWDILRHL